MCSIVGEVPQNVEISTTHRGESSLCRGLGYTDKRLGKHYHFLYNTMSLYTGTGVSRQSQDSRAAGREAAGLALKDAGIEAADVALVLSSSVFNQEEMLKGVAEVLGEAPVIGCTSAGAITGDGVQEQAVTVLVLKSDEAKFIPVKITGIGKDMHGAGKQVG
jgi:hypothetical protein